MSAEQIFDATSTTAEDIIARVARIVPVFPCRPHAETITIRGRTEHRGPKSPITTNGFYDASQDPEQIRAWWAARPDALVGVPTGRKTRLVVIDYDPDKAEPETNEWIAEHAEQLMSTMIHGTRRGGRHYIFVCPEEGRYPSATNVVLDGKKRPGLDIRGEGGYIIWWAIHGGTRTGNIVRLPDGLLPGLELVSRDLPPLSPRSPEQWLADRPRVIEALSYLDPSDYKVWIDNGAILHFASGGCEDGFQVFHQYSRGDFRGHVPKSYGGEDVCRFKWHSYSLERERSDTATLGSLFKKAKEAGWEPRLAPDPFAAQSISATDSPSVEIVSDGFDWPAPADFLKKVTPPGLTAEDVPSAIGKYAEEWAAATGFDRSGVIASCVAASSGALSDGLRLLVSQSSSYYESARLWTVLVGPPGVAKTPSIGAATAPIKVMHREMFEEWKKEAARLKSVAKARDEEAEVPPRPALYTSDATIEALAELLVGNPRGLLFLSEEFESWLGSHDAYRGGGGSKDRGEWLRAYDGGPHQVDRVKRGSFYVPNWGIGILSATTPGALRKMSKHLPADGLLQRFLPVCINPGGDPHPDADVGHLEQSYHNTLQRLLAYGPGTGVRVVSLGSEADQMLRAEMKRLRRLALDVELYGESFAGHVAKHAGMLARITLAFHALSLTDGRHPADVPVDGSSVALAIRFMRKVFRHALAVYSDLLGNDTTVELARSVARFLLAGRYQQIARRDLAQSCKAFRKAENERLREEAMQFLVDMAWVRELDGQYTKSHATHWAVNPTALVAFERYGQEHKERSMRVREAIVEGV